MSEILYPPESSSPHGNDKTSSLEIKELVSVAIDIGTAFSGFAIQNRGDFKVSPLKVYCQTWAVGELGLLTKTKSCILLNSDKTFVAFGYEAEKTYSQMSSEEVKENYFIAYFKMELYNSKLRRNVNLVAANGQKLRAHIVFSQSIRYLKEQALVVLQNTGVYKEKDVKWILTVPAIWSEPAKQFMTTCCKEAGIPEERLELALEPEAAALFCNYLELERTKINDDNETVKMFANGRKFMVLDLGGGTVDITAFSVDTVHDKNVLREIYKASGGPWGGRKVDEAFENFWITCIGKDEWNNMKLEYKDEIFDLFQRFEIQKRSTNSRDDINIMVPECIREIDHLSELVNNMNLKDNEIKSGKSESKIKIKRGKIAFPKNVFIEFYKKSLEGLSKILKDLLEKDELSGLTVILMVGGFSDSTIVQSEVRKVVEDTNPEIRVIIPNEAGSVVLKGACIFGFAPDIIMERISRHTYGVASRVRFDSKVHERNSIHYQKTKDGEFIEDSFHPFVRIDEKLPYGTKRTHTLRASTLNFNGGLEVEIYASTERNPIYTGDLETDGKTFKLGHVEFPNFDITNLGKTVTITMCFGKTKLNVTAKLESGEQVDCQLSLLK